MKNTKFKFILIIVITFFISCIVFAEEKNYCLDKESWKEWDELIKKHPHNMNIQMLHAVRIGLCKKIEQKTITFEKARDVFNQLHQSVYQMAIKEEEYLLKESEL